MIDYNFPGTTGVLDKPITVSGTNIEIVRPYDGRKLTTVLFDFDGTLSLERDGWPDLMVSTNSAALAQAVPSMRVDEAVKWVIEDIEKTIGLPTYMQMKRLTEYIKRRGGTALEPQRYKDTYNNALVAMVRSKYRELETGELTLNDLRVTGALDLLKELSRNAGFKGGLYLASGTDIGPIEKSARLLKYKEYFGKRIVASGSTGNPEQCPKKLVIDRLIKEQNLQSGQILCFGDGFPEILYAYHANGVCVGVLTPDHSHYEHRGHFTVENKRARLIHAGAHILVPDFRDASYLVQIVCSHHFREA